MDSDLILSFAMCIRCGLVIPQMLMLEQSPEAIPQCSSFSNTSSRKFSARPRSASTGSHFGNSSA
jgi:hypothetical protein